MRDRIRTDNGHTEATLAETSPIAVGADEIRHHVVLAIAPVHEQRDGRTGLLAGGSCATTTSAGSLSAGSRTGRSGRSRSGSAEFAPSARIRQ
jgi:hypothetical protein